ncbi:MAG: phosphate/phosphite/phosphonate ABC transporter substrate-binding protein [Steroidobacteraceae bacterium]
MSKLASLSALLGAFLACTPFFAFDVAAGPPQGDAAQPLRVLLIPADGGTDAGTRADFEPLFAAVGRETGLKFDLRVGQSYGAVVEALKAGLVDVAWLGPVAYVQARSAGAAELLAVSVTDSSSTYYAAIFVRKDAPVRTLADLRGRKVAFGDVNSASSFTYQIAMLQQAGVDPAAALGALRITGSHAASLAALAEGQVDAACLSFESFSRAAEHGTIDPADYRVLARSEPIPNPPLVLSTRLPPAQKDQLRDAFANVHHAAGISAEMVRGYGGKRVDRYDTTFPDSAFDRPAATLSTIDDTMRTAILRKAAQR